MPLRATTLYADVRASRRGRSGSARNGVAGGGVAGDGRIVPVRGMAATMPYNVRTNAQASFAMGWLMGRLPRPCRCAQRPYTRLCEPARRGRSGSARNGVVGAVAAMSCRIGPVHGKAATMPHNVRTDAQASFGTGLMLGSTASPMRPRATTLYAAVRASRRGRSGSARKRGGWWSDCAASREGYNDAVQREDGCTGLVWHGLAGGTTASPMPLRATTLYAAVRRISGRGQPGAWP